MPFIKLIGRLSTLFFVLGFLVVILEFFTMPLGFGNILFPLAIITGSVYLWKARGIDSERGMYRIVRGLVIFLLAIVIIVILIMVSPLGRKY